MRHEQKPLDSLPEWVHPGLTKKLLGEYRQAKTEDQKAEAAYYLMHRCNIAVSADGSYEYVEPEQFTPEKLQQSAEKARERLVDPALYPLHFTTATVSQIFQTGGILSTAQRRRYERRHKTKIPMNAEFGQVTGGDSRLISLWPPAGKYLIEGRLSIRGFGGDVGFLCDPARFSQATSEEIEETIQRAKEANRYDEQSAWDPSGERFAWYRIKPEAIVAIVIDTKPPYKNWDLEHGEELVRNVMQSRHLKVPAYGLPGSPLIFDRRLESGEPPGLYGDPSIDRVFDAIAFAIEHGIPLFDLNGNLLWPPGPDGKPVAHKDLHTVLPQSS